MKGLERFAGSPKCSSEASILTRFFAVLRSRFKLGHASTYSSHRSFRGSETEKLSNGIESNERNIKQRERLQIYAKLENPSNPQ